MPIEKDMLIACGVNLREVFVVCEVSCSECWVPAQGYIACAARKNHWVLCSGEEAHLLMLMPSASILITLCIDLLRCHPQGALVVMPRHVAIGGI